MATDQQIFPVHQAQALRLKRTAMGFCVQACTVLIVTALYALGMIPGLPALIYLAMILALDIGFIAAIKTGFNLRFKDPSLTTPQITLSVLPVIYIMFFVMDPQARMALLLMGTSSLLFGIFGLSRRGMLQLAGVILAGYLALLLALYLWAPGRINPSLEVVVVFAYACVLGINAYIGSSVAMMRQKLKIQNRELADLARLDPLTRLPNRRSLMAQLMKESARSERHHSGQQALCVSMLDVDNFKQINDTWGHEVGDRILCQIGEAMRSMMREGDFVGRFGGEEFLIILPETSLEAARTLAVRICDNIAAMQFVELPAGERVTVSLGVAVQQRGEHIESTLKRADDALYRAKDSGRNLVAC